LKIIDFFRDIFQPGKTYQVNQRLTDETKLQLDIEDFAIQMAINMLSGLIAKCEIKTYIKGTETKSDEYYLWNVEPNSNQNSSQFMQQLVSKLLYDNEALVVEVNGQLLIADSFTPTGYALFPATFSNVTVTTFENSFTFDRTFDMDEVLYFKLNNRNIRVLLSEVMAGYSKLLEMAMGKYKRAGGRKGVAEVNKTASGDQKSKDQNNDLFMKGFKKYFESENAVVTLPNGVKYTEITGEGSKKSTSEVTDISNITKEAFSRVAQALRIPPALLQGDIADISKLIDELLTVCIDPLVDLIQTEIIRKRYGKEAYLAGTYLRIDTTCIMHIDIFSIADQADKLIADSLYSVDELRQKIGDAPLNTWWSKSYGRTANYNWLADKPPDDSKIGGENSETNSDNLGGEDGSGSA
jgi:HK97 family phage portal protein